MNYNLFPDRIINVEGQSNTVSASTDWTIIQTNRFGIIEIKLYNRTSAEAYSQAKAFGINVDRKWWQFWIARPSVWYKDTRTDQDCYWY